MHVSFFFNFQTRGYNNNSINQSLTYLFNGMNEMTINIDFKGRSSNDECILLY
jgi:hypothetical protein